MNNLAKRNSPFDVVTVMESLRSIKGLENAGREPYLFELAHNTPSMANIIDYPEKLHKLKLRERQHNKISGQTKIYGFDLTNFKMKHRKDQIIRNLVNPNLALHILNCAFKTKQQTLSQ